jgi:hypothetical protein
MKMLKFSLIAVTVFTSGFLRAQTADDIIAKHLEAIGGAEKLKGITSVKMENTMSVMGTDAPSTTYILNGKGWRTETDFNGQKMVQVYSDKGAWMINPMMGATDPQPMPDEVAKSGLSQIYIVPFLDYKTNGDKVELLGQEKVGDVNSYKIKVTDKNSTATTYYIDPTTYYLIQVSRSGEMMGQSITVNTSFSDFKKTDYGWVVPQKMNIDMGQFSIAGTLKNVEVNKEVDPKIFDMPGK